MRRLHPGGSTGAPPRPAGHTIGTLAALTVGSLVAAALTVPPAFAASTGSRGSTGSAASRSTAPGLYLVTLRGPGSAPVVGPLRRFVVEAHELDRQQQVLDAVGAPRPVYRWTTALDGFAVRLTPGQASAVAALPAVALVEHNTVRPLATTSRRSLRSSAHGTSGHPGHPDRTVARAVAPGPRHGGRGIVVGMIDSGIAPDSPLFARPGNGQIPDFRGSCPAADEWAATDCNGKIVAATSYVAGFGAGHTGSTTSLSPLDTDGHGTAMASIAAGNAAVPVDVAGRRLGRTGGQAPQAALAIYKACWDAPEPSGDGCATADLVTAIDEATRDGVDVLSLAVGGPDRIDTVDLALLGATEAGIVVVAAAGNAGPEGTTAHPSPWVTTVGAVTDSPARGRVVVTSRHGATPTSYAGSMLAVSGTAPRRVVLGSAIAGAGVSRAAAAVCAPGSLDAGRAHGAIVVCRGGDVAPTEKAQAVTLADGSAMVLLDGRSRPATVTVEGLPTLELARSAGQGFLRRVGGRSVRARLVPVGLTGTRARLAPFTPSGTTTAGVVKPDLVAPGTDVVTAAPGTSGDGWAVVTGTSAAAAATTGAAADLLARPGWDAAEVRSALATTAAPVAGAPLLRAGAGRLQPQRAQRPGLAVLTPVSSYRAWFEGRRADLDVPSVVLDGDHPVARRTVTNLGHRHLYFSSSALGFASDVEVTPAALRLAPGQTARFTVRLLHRRGHRVDDGYVVWRGATGTTTRLPVVVTRR